MRAVPNRSTYRCVVVGLFGAVVATALGFTVSPDHSVTATSLFARAVAYVELVFGATALTTYAGLLLAGNTRNGRTTEVAVHTATTALWLPPLLMFGGQRSWFALIIWAVLAVEVARLMAFLGGRRLIQKTSYHDTPE